MPNVPTNILINDGLAAGLDRNNGTGGKGGTPSNSLQLVVNAAGNVTTIDDIPIEELADSPIIERAEQCTSTHHFRLSYTEAKNRLAIYGRGALVGDSYGNYYRVLSASIQNQQAGTALLTIVTESISFDVPPDEFSCTPVKLGIDILKHPRYFFALMPTNQIPNFTGTADTTDQIIAKQAIIRAIQAYRENPVIPTASNINNMIGLMHDNISANFSSGRFVVSKSNPNYNPAFKATDAVDVGTSAGSPPAAASANGDPNPVTYFYSVNTSSSDPNQKVAMALAAGREIIGKLWRMEDTPPVAGVEMRWSSYYFRPPLLNLGGYVEDPFNDANPPVPDYFFSTDYPPDSLNTIFDGMSYFNPQCYSATGLYGGPVRISWLRDADVYEYSRTWFKWTRIWQGAFLGAWDQDINSSANRPQVPGDYRNLLM